MANLICWICDDNLALKVYKGKLTDEEGNNPCSECVKEDAEYEESEHDQDDEV